MAISKTQNERPAIIELIDLANQLEGESSTNARNIETLTEGLAGEVTNRETADTGIQNQLGNGFAETSVTTALGETNQQVTGLQNQLGNGFAETSVTTALESLSEDVSGILATLENIKFGLTGEITVQANTTSSNSYVYPEAFAASAKSFAFLGFADATLQTTLSVTLLESTYSGFRYSVSNTGSDPATVNVGYLAIAVIPLS